METEEDKSRYIVSSVDSALSVLELVSRHPGASLVELSKMAGLNKSRTMRFLVTLEARGFVQKDDTGNFRLSTRMAVLGDRAREQIDVLQLIQPILDRLRDKTSETVQYRILDGLQTLCLAKAESPLDIRVHTDIGRPRELYIGSSKSILAFGDEKLLQDVLAAPRSSYTEHTLVDSDDLQQQLEEIRANGFSVSRSERIEGAVALGAPIQNPDGSVTSCLSLLGPEFRIASKTDQIGALLMQAASEAEEIISGAS